MRRKECTEYGGNIGQPDDPARDERARIKGAYQVWAAQLKRVNRYYARLETPATDLGLIDNWTKPECGGRAETEYQEVQ